MTALPERLRRRAIAIPNPVLEDAGPGRAGTAPEPGLVVALGRLVPQKGFDLLIDAWSSVVDRTPTARLEIWGDGPEADRLGSLVGERGLEASVTLAGETRDPATALGRASVFVLSSRVEGFPNVLLEAMALGRPVVAFDCPFGPAEIVSDDVDGRLVPAGDVAGLAATIADLLISPERAAALGVRATAVRERFAFGTILGRWSDLVDHARDGARPAPRS